MNLNFGHFSTSEVLDNILEDAVSKNASDVHFEPEEKSVRLRYRIDGVLADITLDIPHDIYKKLVSRIKLLSGLKINITDRAQDGRFSFKKNDLRVSLVPSEFGETVVLRILNQSVLISINGLGLRSDDLDIILKEIKKPNGMILNTGPTGSGKTTTLYSFLNKLRTPAVKIITIEDPIEYKLEGVEQTQIDDDSGYTFANGLAALMRQDPDIILVGEIRDEETAAIAVQAALTGHLVFSTAHANGAAGAIPRLLDLKVKPINIGPALNLILAQRLARLLCECKKESNLANNLRENIDKFLSVLPGRVNKDNYKKYAIFEPVGCELCGDTGYRGRTGIFELLQVDKDIETLIEKQASESEIFEFSLKQWMVTMQQDGILKVLSGLTSFEEIERVTGRLNM